jgi:glycosyltransferase involved in cell wall biosynthesis
MRLLFVVQRYGHEVAGGAELHCRQFATILTERGHDVDALTSCATSYVDWADFYEPGTSELDGVTVHRLPVRAPRDDRLFGPLNGRVVWGRKPVPLYLQEDWMRKQGPYLPDLAPWLAERSASYDVVIFFTYLYYTTWMGLHVTAGRVPTVLHPTAHDEPSMALTMFDTMFRLPTRLAFSVEEEAALVHERFGRGVASGIIGIGTDLDAAGDPDTFRRSFGLDDRPYLVFIGRVDPGKGSQELYEFFVQYKARNPGPLALVIVGEAVTKMPDHPDIVMTGFVSDDVRDSALAGALALVQPSYFESFSMVLTEAWAMRRPALVQGRCEVLAGQTRRSGGGIAYRGFAEFEVAVDALLHDEAQCARLGRNGRRYVEERYSWDAVMARYERLLETTR